MKFLNLIWVLAGSGSFATNIVQDPGFEARGVGSCQGTVECGPGSAWTFIDAVSGSLYAIVTNPLAAHGGANGAVFAGTSAGFYDAIEQTLATTAGAAYALSFWLNTDDDHSNARFQVFWGGTLVYDLPPGSDSAHQFPYTQISLAVQATGSSTVLRFAGYNVPSFDTFDDVSVEAVPEPASWMLAGAGAVALALRRLRQSPSSRP